MVCIQSRAQYPSSQFLPGFAKVTTFKDGLICLTILKFIPDPCSCMVSFTAAAPRNMYAFNLREFHPDFSHIIYRPWCCSHGQAPSFLENDSFPIIKQLPSPFDIWRRRVNGSILGHDIKKGRFYSSIYTHWLVCRGVFWHTLKVCEKKHRGVIGVSLWKRGV